MEARRDRDFAAALRRVPSGFEVYFWDTMPEPPPLDDIHIDLLMLIWKDWWVDDNAEKGVPRSELIERLRADYKRRGMSNDDIPAADTVDGRCTLFSQLPKLIEVKPGRSRGGRRENIFRIVERSGAGLPTSARLLVEVSRARVIPTALLVEKLESLKLADRPGYPEFSKELIVTRIDWAVKTAKYLIPVHGDSLGPNPDRLDYEIRYIERVSAYCIEDGKVPAVYRENGNTSAV